jgi:hypothetical protein
VTGSVPVEVAEAGAVVIGAAVVTGTVLPTTLTGTVVVVEAGAIGRDGDALVLGCDEIRGAV